MKNSEICENCGHQKKYHRYNSCCGDSKCTCKKFTPKIEKFKENNQKESEVREVLNSQSNSSRTPADRKPEDFGSEKEKNALSSFGFSTHDEEIIEKIKKNMKTRVYNRVYCVEQIRKALSLQRQENNEKIQNAFKDDELINNWIEQKVNEKLSSLKEKIEGLNSLFLSKATMNYSDKGDTWTILKQDWNKIIEELQKILQEMEE